MQFYLAGFGPPAPVDEAKLVWAEPRNACASDISTAPSGGGDDDVADLSGMFVLAVRGECSFVDKVNIISPKTHLPIAYVRKIFAVVLYTSVHPPQGITPHRTNAPYTRINRRNPNVLSDTIATGTSHPFHRFNILVPSQSKSTPVTFSLPPP